VSAEPAKACLDCGTCCFSLLDSYARVLGADHARLAGRAGELTVFIGNRCYMKMHDGHCGALVLEVLSGQFVCGVYEQRPDVCRELERGSPACDGERQEKSERPAQLMQLLRPRTER